MNSGRIERGRGWSLQKGRCDVSQVPTPLNRRFSNGFDPSGIELPISLVFDQGGLCLEAALSLQFGSGYNNLHPLSRPNIGCGRRPRQSLPVQFFLFVHFESFAVENLARSPSQSLDVSAPEIRNELRIRREGRDFFGFFGLSPRYSMGRPSSGVLSPCHGSEAIWPKKRRED